MKYIHLFIISILISGFIIIIDTESQETSATTWQKLSVENATQLISAFEFQLETPVDLAHSSVYIDNLHIIPNTSYLFIAYKDRDTRQRFAPMWQIWDFETQELVFSENSSAETIAFSPDGQFFALRETFQKAETKLCLWRLDGFTRLNCWNSGSISDNSFHPTNDLFFFYRPVEGDSIYELIIWDIASNQALYIIDDANEWNFNPTNDYQIVASNADIVRVWDIQNGIKEVFKYRIGDEVIVSNIIFDVSAENLFFLTFSLIDSTDHLNRLNVESSAIKTKSGRVFNDYELFSRLYVRLFAFVSDDYFNFEWVDGLTYSVVRDMTRVYILDDNLNQDLLLTISYDEPLGDDIFVVQDLYTAQIYATLPYIPYQDVQFTQDERFIIAYTEDGHVQLWGVPVE